MSIIKDKYRVNFAIIITMTVALFFPSYLLVYAQTDLKKYDNPQLGISFQYPAEWKEPSPPKEGCNLTDYCRVNFIVLDESGSSKLEGGLTSIPLLVYGVGVTKLKEQSSTVERCNCNSLKDFVAWDYIRQDKLDKESGLTNIYIGDNQTVIGNNHSAWQMEQLNSDKTTKTYVVWAIEHDQGYRFVFLANAGQEFGKHLGQFRQMLDSFVFVPIKEAKPSFLS